MGLETGTFVDDLVATNPVGATDDVKKGDDHIRLIKSVLKTTFPNATKAFRFETVLTKTTTYPVVAADARALILADATGGIFTITLPLGSAVFAGYSVIIIKSDSSGNAVTVDGNGAETINGAATRSLSAQYQGEKYAWDGSEWKVVSITIATVVEDATPQLGGNLDVNGKEITSASDGNVVINPDGTGIITLGAAVTVDSAGGTDAVITETGIDRDNASDRTFNIQNSGAGNMALQVDGSEVAKLAGPAFTGQVSMAGAFLLSGAISPSQITGNQNNYDPSGLSGAVQLRLNSDASREVTGLAGGAAGRLLIIANIGSTDIVLTSEDASSTAGNRFLFAGGDRTLNAEESVLLRYDGTSSRWRAAHDVIAFDGATVVIKTADETVNNSSTLQNDDHLLFALAASTSYIVDVILLLNAANSSPDFKIGWAVPVSCVMFWESPDEAPWGSSTTGNALLDEGDTVSTATPAGTNGAVYKAFVRNGANAGNLQLKWSQNSAHASNSKVLKHSHMTIRNLGVT